MIPGLLVIGIGGAVLFGWPRLKELWCAMEEQEQLIRGVEQDAGGGP